MSDSEIVAMLDVLVVDDTEHNRLLFSAMLKKMGCSPRVVVDGVSALQAFDQKRPDMVLMDVQMSGMDGFEVVREMRKRSTEWFPILFISANTSNEHVVQGLNAGGDDYLFKPIHFEVFKAKVQTFRDRLYMLQEVHRQREELLSYSLRTKEEGEAAHDFMRQFTQQNRIKDKHVQFFMKSAEIFSGDLIAFARTPSNRLNLLLADSAGHGLTSALAVIPLTQPFYTMSHRGFELGSIVQSINKHVREYLPLPRYVAAVFVCIDPDHQIIQVWNGGCPPALFTSEDGSELVHQFVSKNLPLGVLPPEQFDASMEQYHFDEKNYKLMLCSDGALEAIVESASMLDPLMLLHKATDQGASTLFDGLAQTLNEALQGKPPQDDVALLLANCVGNKQIPLSKGSLVSTQQWKNELHLEEEPSPGFVIWEFSVTLTAALLKRMDIVPFLIEVAQEIEGVQSDGKVFMVLSELFNNALDHGLLQLDSSLKNDPEGMERFYETRAERLKALESGQIFIRIIRRKNGNRGCLDIHFRDSGNGFDYAQLELGEASESLQRHGRGILLLARLCKFVEYFGNGSSVTARLEIES